ncbi:aminotransferase class I/II-fold pyridoxal phosphate-dependent enzyme [Caldinitratiruptor microaerophilus]|uniref:Aminotransferase n=1 Tax=Caldinitratiruptor microaerophilus TaxID=671077 RepID=A0AA35CMZ5_9FIRM|nr:aminotransferase class I/II-fold pyridoxal phosphate-dependent enzyme [Caldinitratiruptor microaerophilus]BDG61348.1 aminotransferase [Caldinitratiruptor microaerophilus]
MERPSRLRQLASSVFAQMDEARRRAVRAGMDVINLSVGSPDLPPAPHVVEALREAALDPHAYGYPLRDLPEFREAVAAWYRSRFGVDLDPDTEVLGLIGSQEGLGHLALALTDPGDLVLVPDPGYPIYTAGPVLAGARLYPYPLRPENGFVLDPEDIPPDVWRQAKLLLVNYPSNPLAAVADRDFFARIVEYARRYRVVVCHDNAYSELAFDGYRPPSFLEVPGAREVGIEINSLSKTFSMAGCRVAYAVGNREVIAALAEVKGHLDYGIFRPIQRAAIAALTGPQDSVRQVAATYQERRDVLVRELRAAGWDVPSPRATMFLWAPLPPGHRDSAAFAAALLERTGVAVTPGAGFGPRGEGYVRIALVQPAERLREAARRIRESGVLAGAGAAAAG